jgi:Tfp pilus assembly protein PilF
MNDHDLQILGLLFPLSKHGVNPQTTGHPKTAPSDPVLTHITNEAYEAMLCKDFSKAAKILDKALSADPNNANTLLNLAIVYYNQGKIEDSRASLHKIIENEREKGCPSEVYLMLHYVQKDAHEPQDGSIYLDKACEMGDQEALKIKASMNPYAKLCSQMIGQLMAQYN